MEAHKLRFVRCPKCNQLLVEYPSIPVYKCGGCGAVLRAKHRASPATQAGSESEGHSSVPSSLNGSPQSTKSICLDEQRTASSDKAGEDAADGNISCATKNTDSGNGAAQGKTMSAVESVTRGEHLNKEACSLIDANVQSSGFMAKEIHGKDTGASSGSSLTENVEKLDTVGGKVASVCSSSNELSALCQKTETEIAQREEKLHTYEGVHVESHEALIEELERSLSFSSDDEYFSDEAENSGLSDALRHQMGSRRFILGAKTNDASRSDPHGRLIEELEMSFSDVEEPVEQHAAIADRVHGYAHGKLQNLATDSSHPCEENTSSFKDGNLKRGQAFREENKLPDDSNKVKEECYTEDNSTANCVNGDGHIIVADLGIAETSQDSGKDWQPIDMEHARPYEGSVSSLNDGNIKDNGNAKKEECHTADDSIVNCVNGNMDAIVADEGIAEVSPEHGKDQQSVDVASDAQGKEGGSIEDDSMAYNVHGIENLVPPDDDIAERVHVNEELMADHTRQNEEAHVKDDNSANCGHANENTTVADEDNTERLHSSEELMTDPTGENEENHMKGDNTANCVNVNENFVAADEDIAECVHGNEELTVDHAGENEEGCIKDDNMANCAHVNQSVAALHEHIANKNEHAKDWQSLEFEREHLGEGVISSFNAGHIKSERSFQNNELIADEAVVKQDNETEDINMTNYVQEDSAAVARFSSLSNERTQRKIPDFSKKKEEIKYRGRASQLCQELSFDSEDFKSIQKFIESQMKGSSSSLPSGSPNQGDLVHRTSNRLNNNVRDERLKKMDELRDQLNRLSSQKGLEKRYEKGGPECQQHSNSYDVEQYLRNVDADSITDSCALESYYGQGRPARYQVPDPFSPTHSYTHCHLGYAQTCIPHNYDSWEFNSYYQSSYAESTILDHGSFKSSYKEQKRVVRKHILRPLSGASPYTICSSCFNLVQMPSDIYISKAKVGKMQCGKCSKVLVLPFPALYNAVAKTSKNVAQQSYKPDDSIASKNEDITSYYAECLTGDPVSINEEYGASFTGSASTQAGSCFPATQSGKKVSDSALHRLMGYDSASQLLRHSRVFEDGYDSFESMVPVSSRVSRRKNK